MPELPEVETVKRILNNAVKGRTIIDVNVLYKRLIQSDYSEFITNIKGLKIGNVNRKGKFLVFDLGTKSLIVHLRMEGKFFHLNGLEANLDKHTSLYFTLDDGSYLFFKDTRKFGVMYLKDKDKTYIEPPLTEVGPEPFEITEMDYLKRAYSRINKSLKEALLDQKIMCGLGNIYADEVAFASKLSPFMKAKDITEEDSKNLILNSRIILKQAIENGGSTIKSYHPAKGISGLFQTFLKVYGHENQECPTCHTKLKKRFVGGRGTTFCPKCQHVSYTIGLTGEIASGKSTVLKLFKDLDVYTFSADECVHNLYTDPTFIKLLKLKFPEVIIDNSISKDVIYNLFNTNKTFKARYERFIWSVVKDKLNEFLISHTDKIVVAEIPLLFNAGYDKLFSFTIGVEAKNETRLKYLSDRDADNYNNQNNISKSNKYAENRNKLDYIISNEGSIEDLNNQVKEIYSKILNS